ncbi:MAG: hypothetical protein ACM3UZ_15850 [Acidobacteriota bacterium]
MRLIARMVDRDQIGALVDSLKNAGFDRDDMVISDLEKELPWKTTDDALNDIALVKTEVDSIGVGVSMRYADGIEGLKGRDGVIVAVEMPKKSADKIRAIMEQSGAAEIIQD